MFIGHFGVGLGAKKADPSLSLGTLFVASQWLDLIWPIFVLLGWEKVEIAPGITKMAPLNFTHYPWSHSLLMACVWGVVIGGIYYLIRHRWRGTLVLALCIVSHWVLDLIVHRPDLPLYPGNSPLLGMGLWNHEIVEILVEGGIFIVGVILYLQATRAKNKIGSIGFWALILFLVFIHLANLIGPPPTNVKAIGWAGLMQWIFVFWAYWVDRNRLPIARKKKITQLA